jgi:hypothetical protein
VNKADINVVNTNIRYSLRSEKSIGSVVQINFGFKTLQFRTNRACMRQSEVHACGSWLAITHAHALSDAKLELGLIQSKRQEFL